MTIFPELERQLRQLAPTADASHRAPARRSRSRWTGRVSLTVSALVVVAVVAVVIVLASHHGAGLRTAAGVGSARADRQAEMRYLGKASRKASGLAVCRTKTPEVVTGSPPRAFVAILSSLRASSGPTRALPRLLRRQERGIYIDHTRLAVSSPAGTYWLAPVSQTSRVARATTPACEKANIAALNAEMPQIPSRLRGPTEALQRRQFKTLRALSGAGVCLLIERPSAFADSCTANARELRTEGMYTPYGVLSGVVPDGVARVRVRYVPGRNRAPVAQSVPVNDNVFVTHIKLSNPTPGVYPVITWEAADGKTIKIVRGRGAASGSACGGRNTHAFRASPKPCSQ
jgi:hypothetical protein